MTRKMRSLDHLRAISIDLRYEVTMLNDVARILACRAFGPGPVHNALVESFVVHVRNILDFLWPIKPKTDWVTAEDFFSLPQQWRTVQPAITPLLTQARIRAAQRVAHLSYARLRVTPETKSWRYVEIARQLERAMGQFSEHVPAEVLDASWNLPGRKG